MLKLAVLEKNYAPLCNRHAQNQKHDYLNQNTGIHNQFNERQCAAEIMSEVSTVISGSTLYNLFN